MRKLLLSLVLVSGLVLSGCSTLLERDYLSVTKHPQNPTLEADTNIAWVENYQELVTAILYQVRNHQEVGIIRLRNYVGDSNVDVPRACQEISHEEPIGAYGVNRIRYSLEPAVLYQEATVTVEYRRTKDQQEQVLNVTGTSAIRTRLQQGLQAYASEVVMQINYFDQDTAYIHDLVREAYFESPAYALGMPKVTVTLYPESGTRRIAEVTFAYQEDVGLLKNKVDATIQKAENLVTPLSEYQTNNDELLGELWRIYVDEALGVNQGLQHGNTAYDALLGNGADSLGHTMAFALLADLVGLETELVTGEIAEDIKYWLIVETSQGYRHVAPWSYDGYLLTDDEMELQLEVTWDRDHYPACQLEENDEI